MTAAGYTSQQVRIISSVEATEMSDYVAANPVDDLYEGTACINTSSGIVLAASAKAMGLAKSTVTWLQASGTISAADTVLGRGIQRLTLSKEGMAVLVPGQSDWTIGTAIYSGTTGILNQSAGQKIGVAVSTRKFVYNCQIADF